MYKRYIPIKCLCINNDYIPFWKLTWSEHEDFGEGFDVDGVVNYGELVDCLWDSLDKVVVKGIIKDIYPTKFEFSVDDIVLREVNYNTYCKDVVVGIEYTEYESIVKKGSNFEAYELVFDTELCKDDLYEMRHWKSYYRLKSGILIRYDYQLKHFQ